MGRIWGAAPRAIMGDSLGNPGDTGNPATQSQATQTDESPTEPPKEIIGVGPDHGGFRYTPPGWITKLDEQGQLRWEYEAEGWVGTRPRKRRWVQKVDGCIHPIRVEYDDIFLG